MQKQEFEGATLYCADCAEIMPKLEIKADMVCCDPPYGMTDNEWDVLIPFDFMWREITRLSKDNAATALFSAQPFASDLIQSNRGAFRYDLVWRKAMAVGFLNANKMPLRNHELILLFYSKLPYYNAQKTKGEPYLKTACKKRGDTGNYGVFDYIPTDNSDGARHPVSVWDCGLEAEKYHPTQKPLALLKRLIMSYTREGETVLDFTMGSGSTGAACAQIGRRFIGIEKEPKYFDIACARIENALAQGRLF